ncbi:unnamed protein product [Protopolystoma xenopodis]|uniref:Uncharacterized protein n=1 Tax=Protopolystoma xenopodis TaxID=117903 RepID=A0A448WEH7_9PLAT|nr:unnamed protein product [Protopolystoma xenopodis]
MPFNRIFTEGVCRLLSQVTSDLVDEDTVRARRLEPLSALIFGSAALLARPGQSLAPLVSVSAFEMLTGHKWLYFPFSGTSIEADVSGSPRLSLATNLSDEVSVGASDINSFISPPSNQLSDPSLRLHLQTGLNVDFKALASSETSLVRSACLILITGIPFLAGLLQLAAWSNYKLHGSRLASIKRIRLAATMSALDCRLEQQNWTNRTDFDLEKCCLELDSELPLCISSKQTKKSAHLRSLQIQSL